MDTIATTTAVITALSVALVQAAKRTPLRGVLRGDQWLYLAMGIGAALHVSYLLLLGGPPAPQQIANMLALGLLSGLAAGKSYDKLLGGGKEEWFERWTAIDPAQLVATMEQVVELVQILQRRNRYTIDRIGQEVGDLESLAAREASFFDEEKPLNGGRHDE